MRRKFVSAILGALLLATLTTQSARAAATITVTGTADNASLAVLAGNSTCDLREAITAAITDTATGQCAAGSGQADTITFAIGSGAQTIDLTTTPLPALSETMTIDGATQPGYDEAPLITIDGGPFDTFHVTASDVTIKGLILVHAVSGGGARAIFLDNGTRNAVILGNFIGTDGTSAAANDIGIEIFGSTSNYIGGYEANAGNVISGNTDSGISIKSSPEHVSTANIIANYIGTNADGTAAVPNLNGVEMVGAGANYLTLNLISGNLVNGISVTDSEPGTWIWGNKIGTNAGGTAAIPNQVGVYVDGTPVVAIGMGNLISGNRNSGVQIENGSSGATIYGNRIGTNNTGQSALPNDVGIQLGAVSGIRIGEANPHSSNLISGNTHGGILFTSDAVASTNVMIQGNRIGTSLDGATALGNGASSSGIGIRGSFHTIGGSTFLAGNLISGNGAAVSGQDVTDLTVSHNKIGTNAAGGGSLPNQIGIMLVGTIEGTAQITNNLITNSTLDGVYLTSADPSISASYNCIIGNANGVERGGMSYVDFRNNWWGAADGPSGSGPGSGDSVISNVTFDPWLTSAPDACGQVLQSSAWSHHFGGRLPGQSSAPFTISLINSGGLPLVINGPVISDLGDFTVSNACDGATIAPGASCLLDVTFTPAALGPRSGTLTIPDSAEGGPHTITLSGLGATGNPPPALKSPKNGAPAYKPPKLSWKKVRTATGYTVEVDNNDDFSSPEQVGSTTRKTSLPTTRLPFGVYFWHVASIDATGQGVYSAPFSYEVTINKSPRKNATLKTGVVTVKWQAIRGSTYTLRINDENAHSVYFLSPSPLSKPSYKFDKTAPIPSGSYSWQVSTDGGSTFTPLWYFTVR